MNYKDLLSEEFLNRSGIGIKTCANCGMRKFEGIAGEGHNHANEKARCCENPNYLWYFGKHTYNRVGKLV